MKKIVGLIFIIHLIGFNNIISGQNFETEYYHLFEGQFSEIQEIETDANNNLYVAGWLTGEVDLDPSETIVNSPENLYRDLFIAKYNDKNEFLNGFFITGYQNILSSMDVDDDGNIYITGTFVGRVDFDPGAGVHQLSTFDSGGGTRMFIAKYSSDGLLFWVHQFGNQNFTSWAQNLYFNNDRISLRIKVLGEFDFDPGPNDVISNVSGSAILELDLEGNYIWSVVVDGDMDLWCFDVDNDQNIIIAGRFRNTINLDFKGSQEVTAKIGNSDAYIAKYDKNHNLLWFDAFGKSFDEDHFNNISLDKDGNIMAIASIESDIEIAGIVIDSDFKTLIKYSKDGEYIDVRNLLPQSVSVYDLLSDHNNNIYLQGSFDEVCDFDPSSKEHIVTPVDGKQNIYLLKLNIDYSLNTVNTLHGNYIVNSQIVIDSENFIYVSNSFKNINSVLFGTEVEFDNTDIQENAVYQKIAPNGCVETINSIVVSGCDSVEVNSLFYKVNGTYKQQMVNINGCDSILTILVSIEYSSYENMRIEACDIVNLNEESYTSSGQYTQVLTNTSGCDSTIVIDVQISTVDIGIGEDMNVLSSLENDADSYQWIDCDTNEDIVGGNNRTFQPVISGNYAVNVVKLSCAKQSECLSVIISNVESIDNEDIILQPNPAYDYIIIENRKYKYNNIEIISLDGNVVYSCNEPINKRHQLIVDISMFESEVYFVRFTNGKSILSKKFIKLR